MKRTKILFAFVSVLAVGSAFTTKQMSNSFTTVKEAVSSTEQPCTMTTALCEGQGQICQDGSTTYYPADESGCVTPLQRASR